MQRKFTFSALVFDAESGELTRNGVKLRVPDQAARILAILLDRAGTVVAREDLRRSLWPTGEVLDYDHSINNSISQLRDVLRDDSRTPRFIETIPKRGYRFVADVRTSPLHVDDRNAASEAEDAESLHAQPPVAGSTAARSSSSVLSASALKPESGSPRAFWQLRWLPTAAIVLAVCGAAVFLASPRRPAAHRDDVYIGIAPF
jgi:DNA-binding winged helix-turn-helix (wHTH) protein